MLIGYGGYSLAFAISSSIGTSGAAFTAPDDGSALADGRTGQVQACVWSTGTQSTSSYVQITVTIDSTLDTTAAQGVVGVCNVSGLPEGTKLVIAGVTQRLVSGARGELSAWALPFATGNTCVIRFYNDVNGLATIAAAAEFAIGEIFVGRILSLPSLVTGTNPSSDLTDITAYTRTAGGQLWQLMRKNYRSPIAAKLGYFSIKDAKGGTTSTISSGANPSGVIDVQTLRDMLSTTPVCAICDTPSAGQGAGTLTSGIRFDKDFMQSNWSLARPIATGQIIDDQPPLWSWNPTFQEAT